MSQKSSFKLAYERLTVIDDDSDPRELYTEHSHSALNSPSIIASSSFDQQELITTNDETLGKSISTIRQNSFLPISKPPSTPRDGLYGILFLLHFLFIALFSVLEHESLSNSFKMYGNAGSWASLLMTVTLIGSFIGGVLCLLISNPESQRNLFIQGQIFSIIFQICLGNILLLINSHYSIFGIVILTSAFFDSFRFKQALKSINFTCAIVQMSLDIGRAYGFSLLISCSCIVILQTFLLLWWGSFFVGMLSESAIGYTYVYVIVAMSISFYWITQFFNGFMSFVVGGCILWYFLREDDQELDATHRVLLYMRCGITTSFGSIAKGALFCNMSQTAIRLDYWSNGGYFSTGNSVSDELPSRIHHNRDSSDIINNRCCMGCLHCSCNSKVMIKRLIHPSLSSAIKFNRLAFCLIAAYGRTYCKAAEDLVHHHPEVLRISLEDHTNYTLNASATAIAGAIAILFGLISDRHNGSSWPLFFIANYLLAYAGISIVVNTYRSAVDALIVSFTERPDRFAAENLIIYLRFLRYSESALR